MNLHLFLSFLVSQQLVFEVFLYNKMQHFIEIQYEPADYLIQIIHQIAEL